MKKLILSATLMAFAIAVQAGEAKTASGKDKAPCCAEGKAVQAKAVQAKASCPVTAAAQAKAGKTCSATASTSACSDATACKDVPTRQALLSPKAAAEVTKKL